MTSLKMLLALKPSTLYPAHGPHIPGAAASEKHIQTYIDHRQEREDQVIALFKAIKSVGLKSKVLEVMDGYDKKRQADFKYEKEYHSGNPYMPKVKEDEVKKRAEKAEEVDKMLDKVNGRMISIGILAHLVYKTQEEKVIWAAKKSLTAHLEKLGKEGKVKKGKVKDVKILEGELKSAEEEADAWEWIE
jgi:endoribonuclease LACTB2